MQNHFNGECEESELLLSLMRENNMPSSVTDIGAERSEKIFNEYYTRICNSSAINKNDADECARFEKSLRYLWELV